MRDRKRQPRPFGVHRGGGVQAVVGEHRRFRAARTADRGDVDERDAALRADLARGQAQVARLLGPEAPMAAFLAGLTCRSSWLSTASGMVQTQ